MENDSLKDYYAELIMDEIAKVETLQSRPSQQTLIVAPNHQIGEQEDRQEVFQEAKLETIGPQGPGRPPKSQNIKSNRGRKKIEDSKCKHNTIAQKEQVVTNKTQVNQASLKRENPFSSSNKPSDFGVTLKIKTEPQHEVGTQTISQFQKGQFFRNLNQKLDQTILENIMKPKITLENTSLPNIVKKKIKEIAFNPILRPDIFNGHRAPPGSILFFGPSGTDKTSLAKAIASYREAPFLSIQGSTLIDIEEQVRTMFTTAAEHKQSVVFIDEIHSLLSARNDSDTERSRKIRAYLLQQIDKANKYDGAKAPILIIGSTTQPFNLDELVWNQFGKRLYIPLPNKDVRKQFLERQVNAEKDGSKQFAIDAEAIDEIARLTKGFSLDNLYELSTEAALIPTRSPSIDIEKVQLQDLTAAGLTEFKVALGLVQVKVDESYLKKIRDWNLAHGSYKEINNEPQD